MYNSYIISTYLNSFKSTLFYMSDLILIDLLHDLITFCIVALVNALDLVYSVLHNFVGQGVVYLKYVRLLAKVRGDASDQLRGEKHSLHRATQSSSRFNRKTIDELVWQ